MIGPHVAMIGIALLRRAHSKDVNLPISQIDKTQQDGLPIVPSPVNFQDFFLLTISRLKILFETFCIFCPTRAAQRGIPPSQG